MWSIWDYFFMQNFLSDFTGPFSIVNLKGDNTSSIKITNNCISNQRTQHLDQEFFITKQILHQKIAAITWVPTRDILVDAFAKPHRPTSHSISKQGLVHP
ncbi:hypothetical protein O181_017792 [Austropuccinia psidii MF-1]|uniref:Copia protein n=1 Tax=Austropuccinia psidii MF-1 TaxID=1389203 RepID=A0A9Q3GSW6_9BASI|nr:hypothetical protein [Austropuccinia psidii MF-1]